MVYTTVVHLYAKDDAAAIKKLQNKLIEASQVYSKDKETVSWYPPPLIHTFAPRDLSFGCSFRKRKGGARVCSEAVGNRRRRFVMQDHQDPRAFTIVERYEQESSQKYHLENPYWKTFDPYVLPLLEKPMDLRRFNELDTSKEVKVE
ncbi:hypothetical protein LTR60_002567 [Cryomyces antarcticus]|nr:hypothetical protein LTR60_002567 [Cryomyces antarcticus]